MEGSRPKNGIKKNKVRQAKKKLMVKSNGCPKPHRLVTIDKKTNMQFLIAPDAEVSLFPKFIVSEISQPVDQSHFLVNNSGSIIHTFGHITREIDFGLGKAFSWQFTLVNLEKPVIGSDFLSHYRLKFNFEKMCLENPETGLQTTNIPTVACECHRDENCHDGWPPITAIFKRSLKHRNHITDKHSRIQFLIGCASEISIFPKSKLKKHTLERFDGSFELHGLGDDVTHVLGWTNQKLDFGTGREFAWKFAVVDCVMPIIGLDFIREFELDQQLKFGYLSLFDRQTNNSTSAPIGSCECGNGGSDWPMSTVLKKSSIFKSENHQGAKSDPKENSGSIQMKTQTSSQNSLRSRQNPKNFDQHPGPSRQSYQNPINLQNYMIFDQNSRDSHHNYRSFNRYYGTRKSEITKEVGFESRKAREKDDKSENEENSFKMRESRVKHRLHVDDKNSSLPFLIGIAAEISVFPKSRLKEEEDLEPFDDSFKLKGPNREIVPILGWTYRILDIGLSRNFTWKFAVLDIEKPILGLDFLLHYGLTIGLQGLIDPSTNLSTPPPSGLCDCGKPCDGWPSMSYSKKKRVSDKPKSKIQKDESGTAEKEVRTLNEESRKYSPTLKKYFDDCRGSREFAKDSLPAKDEGPTEKTNSPEEKIETLNEESRKSSPTSEKDSDNFRGSREPDKDSLTAKDEGPTEKTDSLKEKIADVSHRFHVDDQNSNLPFLIGTAAEVSVFPILEVEKENLELFNGSFKLEGAFEEDVTILGWSTRTLDIGLTREFTWNFAVIDINKPIIGNDFISHYGFTIESQGLIDPETKLMTPPPSGPCDCEKFPNSWPTFSCLSKKPISDPSISAIQKNETEKEFRKSTEKFREDSQTPKQEFNDFEESRESNEDFSIPKEEEHAEKTDSLKEKKFYVEHRLHVHDKNSDLSFLIDSATEVSVFPKSEVKEEDLEPSDSSFKLGRIFGEDVAVLGWTTRTLDIGLTRNFPWKFAVLDIGKSIIGYDFIKHYGFLISTLGLTDPETNLITPPTSEHESHTSDTTDNDKLEKELVFFEIKHRCHVMDKNSQTLFFISETAQVSLFPRSLVRSRSLEASAGSEIVDCIRLILPIYGWLTLKVYFELEREFEWKFAVVDTVWPIIGIDFLNNFGLETDYSMKYSRFLDPKTNLKTSEFTGSCNCKLYTDFPISTALRKLDSDLERFPVQGKLEIVNIGRCLNIQCLREDRMIVVDRETNLPYLICKSAISVFPKSRAKDEEIEPFDHCFDIVNVFGSVVPIYGWIARKLDFGLGRYFIWKFPVLNISAPIIANDFLNHYGLSLLESCNIFDCVTAKTIMSSNGCWCKCQGFHWPDRPDMVKRLKVKIDNPFSDLIELNKSSEESRIHDV